MKELDKMDWFWIGFCVGLAVACIVILTTAKFDHVDNAPKTEIKR